MSCEGCNENKQFNYVLSKAKLDAKKNNTTYGIYFDGQQYQYIAINSPDAVGLPIAATVSQYST